MRNESEPAFSALPLFDAGGLGSVEADFSFSSLAAARTAANSSTSCHNTTMAVEGPLPFNPNSPGAQKLIAAAQASLPVDLVMQDGLYVRGGEVFVSGDRLTAPKALAEQLIASGAAARAHSSD